MLFSLFSGDLFSGYLLFSSRSPVAPMAHLDLPEVFGLPCAFATLHLCVFFFQTARSLREIHYPCVFATLHLCVFFFQTARSLREIHYPCVFAPLRLCVLFFQTAGSLREYQIVGSALAHRARIVSYRASNPLMLTTCPPQTRS